DANELVHHRAAAHDRPVLDDHVAGELDRVGHYHVVSDLAVVSDVGVGHDQAMAADPGGGAGIGGEVGGGVLSDLGVVPDREVALFTGVLEVLRRAAGDRAVVQVAVVADDGPSGHQGVTVHPRAVPDLDVRADHRPRTDHHADAEPGALVDERGG